MKQTVIILAEIDVPEGVDASRAVRSLGDRVGHASLDGVRVGRAEATAVALPVEALVRAMEHAAKVIGNE